MKRLLLICALLAPRAAMAHPIHTTLTVLTIDPKSHTITLSVRSFADDFSRAVAVAAGKAAPRDSSVIIADVVNYVRAKFVIDGVTLESCGIERSVDAYVVCLRGVLPATAKSVTARNLMLTELHPDQVNIVQATAGGGRKTHLFTKASQQIVIGG